MKRSNCIFCKIANGEVEGNKIYEDDLVYATLDINPASKGHTLIIPKKHFENIYDIPEEELNRIILVAKKITLHYQKKLDIEDVNLLHASGKNAQQSVFHFHLHLVPRKEGDGLNLWFEGKNKSETNIKELLEKIGEIK